MRKQRQKPAGHPAIKLQTATYPNRVFLLLLFAFFVLPVIHLKAAVFYPQEQQQNQQRVTGTVTDEAGDVIAGATISIKGSTRGVMTDESGEFVLDDIPLNTVLI